MSDGSAATWAPPCAPRVVAPRQRPQPRAGASAVEAALGDWTWARVLAEDATAAERDAALAAGNLAESYIYTTARVDALHHHATLACAGANAVDDAQAIAAEVLRLESAHSALAVELSRCADAAAAARYRLREVVYVASTAHAGLAAAALQMAHAHTAVTPLLSTEPPVMHQLSTAAAAQQIVLPAGAGATQGASATLCDAQRAADIAAYDVMAAAAKGGAREYRVVLKKCARGAIAAHRAIAAVISALNGDGAHDVTDVPADETAAHAAAQRRRAKLFTAGSFRLTLLKAGDWSTREDAAKRFFVRRGVPAAVAAAAETVARVSDQRSLCNFTGKRKRECRCRSPVCGSMICSRTLTLASHCDCGATECGGALCDVTDVIRYGCICGAPRCGTDARCRRFYDSLGGITLSARGEAVAFLREFTGNGGFSFNVRSALDKRTLAMAFELCCPAGDARVPVAGAALAALRSGAAQDVRLFLHASGQNDAFAGILRDHFRVPAGGGLEDKMGAGTFFTRDHWVALRHRRRHTKARLSGGGRTRGQRFVLLCVVDLRGGTVITTDEDSYAEWPRVHNTPAGTTAALRAQGCVAREYVGQLGHELCLFDPARAVPVALGWWPRS